MADNAPKAPVFDAQPFLQRALALLDRVSLITQDEGGRLAAVVQGVRVTKDLVLTLLPVYLPNREGLHVDGVEARIEAEASLDTVDTESAFRNLFALALRVPVAPGLLPELALDRYTGPISIVFTDPLDGEKRISFGRAYEDGHHDAGTRSASLGAALFDESWGLVGLHAGAEWDKKVVPIARVLRALESFPCWDEIAEAHRLVRARSPADANAPVTDADLARAVRWGRDQPALAERVRRRALEGATLEQLRTARGTAPSTSPEQTAIDRILAGPPFTMESLPDEGLVPFATAARWFRELVPGLPEDAALEIEIRRRRQTSSLRAIVGPHFAPRHHEEAHLAAWLADPHRPGLVLRGPGGIGKSALLANFVLEKCPPARFAWLDFDQPDVSDDEVSMTRAITEQLAWQTGPGPLLLVLDSFETAVQTYGYSRLSSALEAIAREYDDVAVVVGSRTPVPLLRVDDRPAEELELVGLDREVAVTWLVEENVAEGTARRIAEVTRGVPLMLRLARDLVRGLSADEVVDQLKDLPGRLVAGYLYRRILRRLRDETLREHAHWAMVPRRLVPELLGRILDVSSEEAHRLFVALASEATLLEGTSTLVIRADLRNTLLPLLEQEDAARVRRIDTIAAAFWAGQAATYSSAAAEAIYHYLRLGDTVRAEKLWTPQAAQDLRGYAIEEVLPASRAWLEAKLASQSTADRAADLLARGHLGDARAALDDRPRAVGALSRHARTRRVLGFFAAQAKQAQAGGLESFSAQPADGDPLVLEAIVLKRERPALPVRAGAIAPMLDSWRHLEAHRAILEPCAAAVGRLQVDGKPVGTATLVGDRLFLTTRSAVASFTVGTGHGANLVAGMVPAIDLRVEENSEPGRSRSRLASPNHVRTSW
jgi:hypothetical protein